MASQSVSEILAVRGVSKTYRSGHGSLTVLRDISFSLQSGQTCAIVGPSGSGKTTLLGLCAGLDLPDAGSVVLNGRDLASLGEEERALLRSERIGFIFQNFQLMPTLTALENVMVPLELRGQRGARSRAMELLHQVGLQERFHHYPIQLSGGEQQRVAIARAFINEPGILFADEPTGNLDGDTAHLVVDLIFDLNNRVGTTLILVTHDLELAAKTGRILRLRRGSLVTGDQAGATAGEDTSLLEGVRS